MDKDDDTKRAAERGVRDPHAPPLLQPMESLQARYHAGKLRAFADLILAGEPVCWINTSPTIEQESVTLVVSRAAYIQAHNHVLQRVEAGDPDVSIRVPVPESTATPPRRRR